MLTENATSPFTAQVEAQRRHFLSGATLNAACRSDALKALLAATERREAAIADALRQDLGKSESEAWLTETGQVLDELKFTLRNLNRWMGARRTPGVPALWPGTCRIHPEPLGVALILSPWNYPFQLSLLPLIVAVAAGNCAVLKPSSSAPATASVLADIVQTAFSPEHVTLIKGNALDSHGGGSLPESGHVASELLKERFDFIFYTGSTRVGRTVLEAASRHLTPVCLELGGKSPVIVAADANLAIAARRIAWGKCLNAGQTCIAPDHVWVDRRIKDEFLALLREKFHEMAGDDPLRNPNYGHIITDKAFRRIMELAPAHTPADPCTRKIGPTAFDATPDHPAMREEIFGPLLPVLAYDDVSEALDHIRNSPRPLALYLFTANPELRDRVVRSVPFGGGCINDVILHAASHHLPFGGVGDSGMGRYHGKAGFDLFSNLKSVVHQRTWPDIPFRYPSFVLRHFNFIRRILK